MITRAENFLPPEVFQPLKRATHRKRGGLDVYGNLQNSPLIRPVLRQAAARFGVLVGQVPQQVLLRFGGNTGLLHHDLNHRPNRTFSLLVYIDEPSRGGEIIFPFFDPSGAPTANPVTEACQRLQRAGQLYSEDPDLEAYLLQHRAQLLTFQAQANTAVLFTARNPAMWHFACPVEAGVRSCLVVFYQAPSAAD